MNKFTITWIGGKVSSFLGEDFREGKQAFHVKTGSCTVLIPFAWYDSGEVKKVAQADKFVV